MDNFLWKVCIVPDADRTDLAQKIVPTIVLLFVHVSFSTQNLTNPKSGIALIVKW
jgi:hypothetical protein